MTGLPADTLGPAEVQEEPEPGEVLPPQTTPSQDFGKEVSGISSSKSWTQLDSQIFSGEIFNFKIMFVFFFPVKVILAVILVIMLFVKCY